jgi:methylated-DNA-[protein]-cysteine S-methyltransferase
LSPKADLFFDTVESPLGVLYLVMSAGELAELRIGGERPSCPRGRGAGSFKEQLNSYFVGRLREFSHDIVFLQGTDFEKEVWLALRQVPYGETRSYKWLAEKVGRPKAVRAVGRALSRNPVPIVLPCHRIIEADGAIGGYSSGVDVKRRLLDMEYYYLMGKR